MSSGKKKTIHRRCVCMKGYTAHPARIPWFLLVFWLKQILCTDLSFHADLYVSELQLFKGSRCCANSGLNSFAQSNWHSSTWLLQYLYVRPKRMCFPRPCGNIQREVLKNVAGVGVGSFTELPLKPWTPKNPNPRPSTLNNKPLNPVWATRVFCG